MVRAFLSLLVFSVLTLSVCVASANEQKACEYATIALSSKSFHDGIEDTQKHALFHAKQFEHHSISPEQRELLWHYYVLRLMTHRLVVEKKRGTHLYATVADLHDRRWRPLVAMAKLLTTEGFKAFFVFLGSMYLAATCKELAMSETVRLPLFLKI